MRNFAIYLVYIAVIARAIGWNQETATVPTLIWILLAIFGIILFSQQSLTRRFPSYPRLYILVQSVLVVIMLYRAPTIDFLHMLFFPLSFQAVQFFPGWTGFAWIGGFILAISGMFLFGMELQAGVTMVLGGGVADVLMGSFAALIKRTELRRQENQRMFGDLQKAYRQLKDSAAQSEALAAATERHRLVRELHDSLTQTLFSMNLAVQSAQLSMGEDPSQADEHLLRLQTLTSSAASEVQALTGQVSYHALVRGELAAAIRRLAEERMAQDGMQVAVEIAGQRVLSATEEANLYRIAQEALNNISRHAGVRQALVRLRLENPLASLEIEDEGCGFDPVTSKHTLGFGLAGMAERASEIGWDLAIDSSPGLGTRIRVREKAA